MHEVPGTTYVSNRLAHCAFSPPELPCGYAYAIAKHDKIYEVVKVMDASVSGLVTEVYCTLWHSAKGHSATLQETLVPKQIRNSREGIARDLLHLAICTVRLFYLPNRDCVHTTG